MSPAKPGAMPLVVDASVAIKFLKALKGSPHAARAVALVALPS